VVFIILSHNALSSGLLKNRTGVLWSRGESNPRPEKEPIMFSTCIAFIMLVQGRSNAYRFLYKVPGVFVLAAEQYKAYLIIAISPVG